MFRLLFLIVNCVGIASALPPAAAAQDMRGMRMDPAVPMAEPDHSDHAMPMDEPAPFAIGSGTARLPGNEGGMHGLHLATGDWMVMARGPP